MPVLSHVHQLFNAEQCQTYIHTLRWKDRPLQGPRYQSHHSGRWSTYHHRPGCKRSWCHRCKRTFNARTNTLLHQSQRPLAYWLLAIFLLCLACSSRRIATELGGHGSTGYRWCWWLRNVALSYELECQREGIVEADDLYHTAGGKGQAQGGGRKSLGHRPRGRRKQREPGRGHYDTARPALIAWVSRQGGVGCKPHGTLPFPQGKKRRTSPSKRAVGSIPTPLAAIGRQGLRARVRPPYEEGVCPWRCA